MGRLDAGGDGVNLPGHAQVVETLILLAYGVLGVDPGALRIALLQGLADFSLLDLLLLLRLLGQSIQLLGLELELEQ